MKTKVWQKSFLQLHELEGCLRHNSKGDITVSVPSAGAPPRPKTRVFIEDHTANKRREALITSDAPVSELIPALVSTLSLRPIDAGGRRIVYNLAFNSRQLQANETLVSAGVVDGATVTLVPDMVAGSGSFPV